MFEIKIGRSNEDQLPFFQYTIVILILSFYCILNTIPTLLLISMTSRKRLDRNAFHVKVKKPKHISSFNMDPTDNVIQLGWNFISQNETLAVSMHPTKRLIAVLTKQNCFKIFTFDGYFVTLVRFPSEITFTNVGVGISLVEDMLTILSFTCICVFSDYNDEQKQFTKGVPTHFSYIQNQPVYLTRYDCQSNYTFRKDFDKHDNVNIFISDQTSVDEIQLFSIEQDTMIVIPRAEMFDEVYIIYRISISQGKIIAKYTINKLLILDGYPYCVCIDRNMNVYILTPFSDTISILLPDGENARVCVPDVGNWRKKICLLFGVFQNQQLFNSLYEKVAKLASLFICEFRVNNLLKNVQNRNNYFEN